MGFFKHLLRLFGGSHHRQNDMREHNSGYGYPSEHRYRQREHHGERMGHVEGRYGGEGHYPSGPSERHREGHH